MIARVALLACLLWSLSAPASVAHACSCMQQTVEQARQTAAAIFEARVLEVSDPAPLDGKAGIPMRKVQLEVVQQWKGVENREQLEVITAAQGAACGYGFREGNSYLVYAYDAEGGLGVSSCSRTKPRDAAAEDLAALGAGIATVEVKNAKDEADEDGANAKDGEDGAKKEKTAPPGSKPAPSAGCASCHAAEERPTGAAWGAVLALLWFARRRLD